MELAGILPEVPPITHDELTMNPADPFGPLANAPGRLEPVSHGFRHSADEVVIEQEGPQLLMDGLPAPSLTKRLKELRAAGGGQEFCEAEGEHLQLPDLPHRKRAEQADVGARCADKRLGERLPRST